MNIKQITPGFSDDSFIRGEVPITKEEVRIVSLCKLHLEEDSVLYDIGCGTGSISVEAARLNKNIKVYAVDINASAVELTKQNIQKFNLNNIFVTEGSALEVIKTFPKPTHAFIGGSKGELKEILTELYKINKNMRVVINAVTMETVCQITQLLKEMSVKNVETIQLSVNKAYSIGSYNMLMANNPVFIFSFDFVEEK